MKLRNMERSDLFRISKLLSDAFSQGRMDDGYKSTYVPLCRIDFLDMYYSSCPEGCFVIQDRNQLTAVVFSHIWGRTGWIGPLAVTPARHERGLGSEIMHKAIEFLKESGCTTIGLETSPRSLRNLGFYGKLGFLPQNVTVDMMRQVPRHKSAPWSRKRSVLAFSQCQGQAKEAFLQDVSKLSDEFSAGLNYSSLISKTQEFAFGESLLFKKYEDPVAYMTVHTQPPSEEEQQTVLRIISLAAKQGISTSELGSVLAEIEKYATREMFDYLMVRVPTQYSWMFKFFLREGFQIINSELRMTLEGYDEPFRKDGVHLSRWS